MNHELQKVQTQLSSFYLVDLAKQLFKAKNISAILYLVLNVVVVFGMFYVVMEDTVKAAITAIVAYIATSFVALSPVGEWVLRLTQGCRDLNPNNRKDKAVLDRVQPLFQEVLDRARHQMVDFRIDPKIALYIQDDPDRNAFAIGRRTVCITTGLLSCTDEEIKAILGHEVGHLAAHDTDLTLLITAGNFLISAGVAVFKAIIWLYQLLFSFISAFVGGSEGAFADIINTIGSFLTLLCVNLVMWAWTKLGVLMVMHSSRKEEFAADDFSCSLGYGEGLLSFFENLMSYEKTARRSHKKSIIDRLKEKTEVFAVLSSSHPKTALRIERIRSNMAE